jgi:chaperonin GroES
MKLIGIALATVISSSLSSCSAFAPQYTQQQRTTSTNTALQAELLEGWKIDGVIKPVNNFILVQKAKEKSESDGGILLSNSAKIKKTQGKVISTGPGKPHPDSGTLFPMPVKTGDNVVYGQYDGTEINIDGVVHSLIRDDNILIKFTTDDDENIDSDGDAELSLDNVEAVNDGILVYVETKETSTSSGLILSNSATGDKRPSTGKVVKVGPGRMGANGDLLPMNVEVGDNVKFMDFAGNEVKIGDEDYSMVKMPEVLAKF